MNYKKYLQIGGFVPINSLLILKSLTLLFFSHLKNQLIIQLTVVHENSIKYLGIMIDSHLNWKSQVNYISEKIKRNIGILFKLHHYVNLKTLTNLYYSLIYTNQLQPQLSIYKKEFFESLLLPTTMITLTLSLRLLQ